MREVDESHEDLAVFGGTPPPATTNPDEFIVTEANWPASQVFLRMSTQWIYAGMGERIGLNYQSLQFLFTLYADGDQKQLFEEVRIMEMHALAALREGKT